MKLHPRVAHAGATIADCRFLLLLAVIPGCRSASLDGDAPDPVEDGASTVNLDSGVPEVAAPSASAEPGAMPDLGATLTPADLGKNMQEDLDAPADLAAAPDLLRFGPGLADGGACSGPPRLRRTTTL